MIRVEWPADRRAADTWEQLRRRAPTEGLFMTPDWLETWCRHLGSGRPLVFGVEDGGEVVALAPIDRAWVGGLAVLRPLGLGVSDYFDLLLPPEPDRRQAALAAFADALVERGSAWDALDLRGIPAESPTERLRRALQWSPPSMLTRPKRGISTRGPVVQLAKRSSPSPAWSKSEDQERSSSFG